MSSAQRVFWLSAICLGIIVCGPVELFSQQRPGANQRQARRPRAKPGEVITRPDRSERWPDQIKVGEAAPVFTLPLLVKKSEKKKEGTEPKQVSLKDLYAKRPVVLIFGSITCPPFRGQLEGVEKVYQQFQDRAEFLFVYIREAHPDSVLLVSDESEKQTLQKIPQAESLLSRTASAGFCQRTAELTLPIAVDDLDNTVGKAYSGWPNRMVVVGMDGKIVYASPGAPNGTNAQRLSAWLEENLE